QVLAAQMLDHQPLPSDQRAAPRRLGAAVIAGGVGAVAQQALETRAALDRTDRVARRALRVAERVQPFADDLGGAPRIAALQREVRQLDGDLGGRLAFLARAK